VIAAIGGPVAAATDLSTKAWSRAPETADSLNFFGRDTAKTRGIY
jgi:hypothetical protein